MKKNSKLKLLLSCILSTVLVAAIVLSLAGCKNNSTTAKDVSEVPQSQATTTPPTQVGEGEHHFTFTAKDADGKETVFEIKTNEKTVGEALLEEGIIDGDKSEFGLYVKYVNGICADYVADKAYWAFYIGDDLAPYGVDVTDITDGESYSLVYTKS